VCEQLEKHVATIVQALPVDLQAVLRNDKAKDGSASGAAVAAKLLSPKLLTPSMSDQCLGGADERP